MEAKEDRTQVDRGHDEGKLQLCSVSLSVNARDATQILLNLSYSDHEVCPTQLFPIRSAVKE